jgi:hypothetical protein
MFFNRCPSKENFSVSFYLEDTEAFCSRKVGIVSVNLEVLFFMKKGSFVTFVEFSHLLMQDKQIHDPW